MRVILSTVEELEIIILRTLYTMCMFYIIATGLLKYKKKNKAL